MVFFFIFEFKTVKSKKNDDEIRPDRLQNIETFTGRL
jgi:hypothetical protein